MSRNCIHGTILGIDVLHIPPFLKEKIPTMAKTKAGSASSSTADRVTRIEASLETLKWGAPIVIGALITIAVAATVVTFTSVLPEKIEHGISNSGSLNQKFEGVDAKFLEVKASLDRISNDVRQLFTPTSVAGRLKALASLDQKSLREALPTAKALLQTTKDLRLPVQGQDYKEISQAFSKHYATAKEPLKEEVWNILVDLANTRTFTDAKLYPVPDSAVAEAKAAGNYFEGVIDLSSKTTWKDSLFRNCTLTINNSNSLFSLENTRFIDCTFQLKPDKGVSRGLLASFLRSSEPTVNVPKFSVDNPRYTPDT